MCDVFHFLHMRLVLSRYFWADLGADLHTKTDQMGLKSVICDALDRTIPTFSPILMVFSPYIEIISLSQPIPPSSLNHKSLPPPRCTSHCLLLPRMMGGQRGSSESNRCCVNVVCRVQWSLLWFSGILTSNQVGPEFRECKIRCRRVH